MRFVIFVSLIAAAAAQGAFPALPSFNFVGDTDNTTVLYSNLQLFHNIPNNKTCRIFVEYATTNVMLSSLITAFSGSPASSSKYNFPLNNVTATQIGANCEGHVAAYKSDVKNKASQNWVAFADEKRVQFTEFETAKATGFFPTYFSEQNDVTKVELVHLNGTTPLNATTVWATEILPYSAVVFKFQDMTNITAIFPADLKFNVGDRVVFWLKTNGSISTIQLLTPAAAVQGRLSIVNGVTYAGKVNVWATKRGQDGKTSTVHSNRGELSYGETSAMTFTQGDILSGFKYSFVPEHVVMIDTTNFEASLTWGTNLVLAGFNATLVLVGTSNVTATATIFLEDIDEVRAATLSGVKGLVRFANALVGGVESTLQYKVNITEKAAQHAVRRILRPQDIQQFDLSVGGSRSVKIPSDTVSMTAAFNQLNKPEVNGTIDVLNEASQRPEALAFNIFAIGDPSAEKAEYKPRQVTTYDAPVPEPPAPAPTDESNFWSQPWPYIVIAAFVLVVFGGGFYFYKKHKDNAGSEGKPLLG